MRIAGIRFTSLFDGEGINAVVFFQGCSLHCPGCHNPQTWDFKGGTETTIEEVTKQIEPYIGFIDGVTLSGGNPVESWDDANALAKWAQSKGLKVTLYSGNYMTELFDMDLDREGEDKLLPHIDTVIEGPFVAEEKADLPFRGSANQGVYHRSGWDWERVND